MQDQIVPLRTTLHSLQNSVINSSDELKSRYHTGVDANGALYKDRTMYYYYYYCEKYTLTFTNHSITKNTKVNTYKHASLEC